MNLVQKIKLNSAVKYIKKGKVSRALNILNEVKFSSFHEAHYKGICYYELGEFNKAIENFNRALSFKEDYNCTRILSEIYLQQGHWELALKCLRRYKQKEEIKKIIRIIKDEKKRENYVKHNKLISKAMGLMRSKEYEESISCYNESLQYTSDKAEVYNQIGAIYFNYLKDKKMAEEYFSKAYNLSPNNKVFKMNYAKVRLNS